MPNLIAPRVLCLAITTALTTGCATTASPHDPLEPMNRQVFSFNEGLDRAVLKPVATAYKQTVPAIVQTGIANFFSNLQDPWSAVNLVLQGRVGDGATALARFGTNTTVGVLGLMDVATPWGMPRRSEDFGLTLDTWGVGAGPYLVLPILGPSNVRDALAWPVDTLASLEAQVASGTVRAGMTATDMVSQRAAFLAQGDLLDQAALDKYLAVRDIHLQRRQRAAQAQAEAQRP